MRRNIGFVFLCLFLANVAFAQNAQLGGIVADPTKALIPGVTITATNTATGVATTTITNESGAYSFPSLQPGVYRLSAELSGFQGSTVNLELGPIAVRQNFQLCFEYLALFGVQHLLIFRENDRGKFLRITEEAHGRRNTIIVPSTGVDEFTSAIDEVIEQAERAPA